LSLHCIGDDPVPGRIRNSLVHLESKVKSPTQLSPMVNAGRLGMGLYRGRSDVLFDVAWPIAILWFFIGNGNGNEGFGKTLRTGKVCNISEVKLTNALARTEVCHFPTQSVLAQPWR
jgi:hypothetical protein